MTEEFSKLSIKSKSSLSRQLMQWVIPQSRLNQQCPFLERDYPFYITEFSTISTLHPQSKGLELKWKLVLEKQKSGREVVIRISNSNDKCLFERKELRNYVVNVNWSVASMAKMNFVQADTEPLKTFEITSNSDDSERTFSICDVDDFDFLCFDGEFVFDVIFEVEHLQVAKKKMSMLQQARRISASIADLAPFRKVSKKCSESSGVGFSTPSRSWIGKSIPKLRGSSNGKNPRDCHPTYQQCSVPPSPPSFYQSSPPAVAPPSCPTSFYNYRHTGIVQLSDKGYASELSLDENCEKGKRMRTTLSGRFPSIVSNLTRADDTMDSRISGHPATIGDDDDPIYSSIPDNVFGTPQSFQYVLYKPRQDQSSFYWSPASSTLPAPIQRCESTPNPVRNLQDFKSLVGEGSLKSIPSEQQNLDKPLQKQPANCGVSVNRLGLPATAAENVIEDKENVIDADIVEAIYSGFVPDTSFVRRHKRRLLEMAVQAGLLTLLSQCERAYQESLNNDNSLETLILFDKLLPQSQTRQKVLRYIRTNLSEICQHESWNIFVTQYQVLFEEIHRRNEQTWII